jgi:hypothetical protein
VQARGYLIALMGAALSQAIQAQAARSRTADQKLEAELTSLEKASWVAWQRMDAGFWESFLSDDHIELNAFAGPVGKQAVIGGISSRQCHVRSYKVDRFTFRRLDENTAILVYRAEQDTTCGSVTVPTPVWATSVYQLRDGRWQNVLYEHTPIAEPPKTVKQKTP